MKLGKRSLRSIFSWEVLFVASVTLIMVCFYFLVVPFFELVELKAWDLHFMQRGQVDISGKVVFVTIDEESVNREGRWPWPRRKMAELLEAVDRHGARVIGLDMGFFEPDLKLRQQAVLDIRDRLREESPSSASRGILSQLEAIAEKEDDDLILSTTLKQLSIPLVLGHFFYFDKDAFHPAPPPAAVLDKAQCQIVRTLARPQPGKVNEAVGLEYNIPIIEDAARYMGSFNVIPDPDGNVRWMPLVIRYEERLFPSLALQILAAASPEDPMLITVDDQGIRDVRLGATSIPTNNKGEILVNYYGPAYSFPHFSATAILRNEAPSDCLKDRIVVVGNTTVGLFDMRPTPFSPIFPGVELHCTVMENILNRHFLQRSDRLSPIFDMLALLTLALIFIIIQSFIRGTLLAGAVSLLLGGYILLTHSLFFRPGMWLNHIYPTIDLGIAYLGTSVYRYLREEQEKRMIRQTFSLYVHRSVVEEMLAHPERLRLGGEKRELSVLFSDIRGFTTLSEKLPPEELVPQLNEYLTRMTQIVFDNHGTLDKYIGDAIMAIFGAPLPQEDHPYRACATALDMIKVLRALHTEWQEQGRPLLQIGIGINTGLMMVGNMGSERRFDYTVLGDNVNLASRLEGLTKMYGVSIVVNETTWDVARDRLIGRELDVVRVKGKNKPVSIFQVMDFQDQYARYSEPLDVYREAMLVFRNGDWEKALELFEGIETWWPKDAPSLLYRNRCKGLLEHHPGDDWSYITTLDHK